MRQKSKFVFAASILLSLCSFAQEKTSLQNAIQTALSNNPRTQANALRLQASFDRLKAYKQSVYLPTASVGYSQDLQTSKNRGGYASVNLNLFNGFADYYSIQARECNYKNLEASYNSTNTMMQNTSGQIVGLVVNNYVNLVSTRQHELFDVMTLARLKQILPVVKDIDQKTSVENFISSTEISIEESKSTLQIAEADYKYIVNSEVPLKTDSFSEIIAKIEIPNNAETAYEISLQKSPEILNARLSLECDQLSRKAERAGLYSARVDVSLSHNTDFNGANTNSTSAMLNVSVPLDLGRISSYKAGEKNIQATELDLNATIASIKNDLNNDYIRLNSAIETSNTYELNFNDNENKIITYLQNIGQLKTEELKNLINLLRIQQGQFQMLSFKKQQIINLKYSTQRNIGTLFETNKLSLKQYDRY